MPRAALVLDLADFPSLKGLTSSQPITLTIKARVGMKQSDNGQDTLELLPDEIEVEKDRTMSTQEVLLANIAERTAETARNTETQPVRV